MDMHSTTCSVMMNGFQVANSKENCILFLFRGWNVDSQVKYAFTLIGVICMGILNGAFAYIRQRIITKWKGSSSLLVYQAYLSVLYGMNIVLAYWIMLLVMTYETGIFIAVIFGLVLGHFIFGYITARNSPSAQNSSLINNAAYQHQFDNTPCCETVHQTYITQ